MGSGRYKGRKGRGRRGKGKSRYSLGAFGNPKNSALSMWARMVLAGWRT